MSLSAAPRDERRSVGFGLLGYGFMAKAHSHALLTLPHIHWPSAARPQLVAIGGRTEAAVREAATRYGYESWTTDWHDLVADPRVAVFDNVAADAAHVEPTLAAIAAGKHVVCEKPLASSAAEARRLYEAAAAAGVIHLTGFNYRFFPAVRLAWALIHEGELGELRQVQIRYAQEWRTDPAAQLPSPTGVVDIIGCHAIDQARYLCGEIEAVAAVITRITPTRTFRAGPAETDDAVAILARLAGGLVATIEASLIAPGRKNHLAFEISGARGSLAWSLESPNRLRVHRRGPGRLGGFTDVLATEPEHELAAPWWPAGHVLGWEHGHVNMLAHLLDAVAGTRPLGPHGATFLDGLRAAEVAEAVERASASGTWEAVEHTAAEPDGGGRR